MISEPSNFLGDDARPLSVACLHVDSCICVLFYPSRWRTICLWGGSSQNVCYGHVGDTFLPVYVTIHLGIAILIILKSGLGSFILEQLRDDYPLAYILSVAVAPFSLGETPLQHYNTLLCLSWQQTYSDAVLLFQNDYVLQQAQKSTRAEKGAGRHSSEDVSVGEMNRQVSQTLCNSFLPIWSAKQK